MSSGAATRLILSGVTTRSDTGQVEAILSSLPGVYAARVNPATRVAVIRHESDITTAQLIHAVEEAGYRARRAVAGEDSVSDASSPWGSLRPEGRTPAWPWPGPGAYVCAVSASCLLLRAPWTAWSARPANHGFAPPNQAYAAYRERWASAATAPCRPGSSAIR